MITKLIVSSLIAVIVSFLCTLSEAILLSLNPLTMHRLRRNQPKSADAWVRLKRVIGRPIAAIVILNTIALTGGATVAGGAFVKLYGEKALWIFSTIFTIIILFGADILPKIIGLTFRDQLAPYLAKPLEIITKVLSPLIKLTDMMFRKLGHGKEQEQITTADIVTLASLARSGKVIGLEQENIIVNAIRLSHTTIEKVMIPYDKVKFIKKSDTIENVIALANSSRHTRYPISSTDSIQGIYGYVNMKVVLPTITSDVQQVISQAKPLLYVQSSDNLMVALTTMIQNKQHLLSVLDNRKNCVGIITMEDISGELLGADIEMFK